MTDITTDLCKEFIVKFQKDNPNLERSRFGSGNKTDDELPYFKDAINKKNWKLLFKRIPEPDDKIIYISGQSFNRYSEPQGKVNFNEIKCVRGFDMVTADGQIAYLLLEMNDGTFHLGDYIGD